MKGGIWEFGPLRLSILNLPDEWRISWHYTGDPVDNSLTQMQIVDETQIPKYTNLERFGFDGKSDELTISPWLSDRAFVARPDSPLKVPGRSQVTFYMSTPIWLSINDSKEEQFLLEIPSYRPSDTWFGASPVDGELAYVTKTAARLHMEELPFRRHRAITGVTICNLSEEPLAFDKIKIPMPHLSLYRGSNGWFYTDFLSYEWEGDLESIKMKLDGKPDIKGNHLDLVTGPRQKLERNIVARTVRSMFGS
ncbi:MAG: hypothetical protein KDD43_04840 [Bdellovibrionales bacterium]|nr:hypothetical protein [Bdellovibrionales bacterium]